MQMFEVDPTGGMGLDRQSMAGGSKNDQNRSLVWDSTNNVAYMAGFTSSPDFTFTSGSAQPTYGGDPYDGIVVKEQLL
jgi:hypothetical protein